MKPKGKANLLHVQILGALVANRETKKLELRGRWVQQGRHWEERQVGVMVPLLAGNVSAFNLGLAAKRWLPTEMATPKPKRAAKPGTTAWVAA